MKVRPQNASACGHSDPARLIRAVVCAALWLLATASVFASATGAANEPEAVAPRIQDVFTDASVPLLVAAYRVQGDPDLSNAAASAELARFVGPKVTLVDVGKAAAALQASLQIAGHTNVTLTIGRDQITNGLVIIYAFRSALAQVVIDGRRCSLENRNAEAAMATNQSPPTSPARATTPPGFLVRAYEIRGDTLLSTPTLIDLLEKYTGTNITVTDILQAGSDLQSEYRRRGYATVNVTIPPQKLDSNAIVKIRVFQGRLTEVNVLNNRYFSSNNVMRALPSLHTNTILVEPVFQAELDRANANQDRQIYPQISPGPVEGTTTLDLKIKDRLPLHAKLEFNNQSSPGTPDLRLNASAVYNNLWQYDHSFGVQYSFSPEVMKQGDRWNYYDQPLVANYSAFYRLPLGNPPPLAELITTRPGTFGYDEATRKFHLPPASGRTELNFFASRSTIDTGLETLQDELIYNVPGVRQVGRKDVQEDLTINEDVGFRLSVPLPGSDDLRSTFSGGLDFKTYSLTSDKTNNFTFTEITINPNGSFNPPIVSTVSSPVPETKTPLDYLPLSLRYDGSLRDQLGSTGFGLGFVVNTWYSGSLKNLQTAVGSSEASGHWVALNPSLSREFNVYTNWVLALRAEGQWASEPLISTERYGIGGINSVRGYREGEVFGETGWRFSAEQRTPGHVVGLAYARNPLTIRGAVFMDYAEVYPLDPNTAQSRVSLWGTGFGGVVSLGSHWEARFLLSWPLLSAGSTQAYDPRFNFSLSGQF